MSWTYVPYAPDQQLLSACLCDTSSEQLARTFTLAMTSLVVHFFAPPYWPNIPSPLTANMKAQKEMTSRTRANICRPKKPLLTTRLG